MSDLEREKSDKKNRVSSLFETGLNLVESEQDSDDFSSEDPGSGDTSSRQPNSEQIKFADSDSIVRSLDPGDADPGDSELGGSGLRDSGSRDSGNIGSVIGQAITDPDPNSDLDSNSQGSKVDPLIGTVFAEKYEVLSVLGKGGMSTVFKVRHLDLGMIMALKVLHKHLWTDPLSVERFRQEAKTIGKLSSPYLITFRDFGVTGDGQPYLVMDYLKGTSLGQKISVENGIKLSSCLDIFGKLLEGLEEAHKNGVIHRDIKPANVMFFSEGGESTVKFVDFGIAKLAQEDADQRLTLTQTGEVFGSPLYMSPEQCRGLACDQRSDIYSLGCLFFESLVGAPPFIGSNVLETMNSHVDKEPIDIMKANQNLILEAQELGFDIRDLNYLVMKCLQKVPGDRYQNVGEAIDDLNRIRGKNTIVKKQKLWKKANPKQKILSSIVSVMALFVVTFWALYFANPQVQLLVNSFGRQVNWQYNISMGRVAFTLRDFEAAEGHYRASLALANQIQNPSDRHVKRLSSLESLASALQFQAKYPEKDKVIEEHKLELRQSLIDLANVEEDDSEGPLTSNPETKEAALANALYFDKLGKVSARSGKTAVAAKYLEKSYQLKKQWLKPGDEGLIRTMDALASVYVLLGKRHRAGYLWNESFRQAEKYLSDDSSVKVSLYDNMGRIRQHRGTPEEALKYFKKALELARKHYGESSKTTIDVMKDYAALLNKVGKKEEAELLWAQITKLEAKSVL